MDTPEKSPTVLSLCSGYGGIERGIELALGRRVKTLAYVEIEFFAIKNLVDKMEKGQLDPCPIWTNLKTLPVAPFRGKVDILTGGFPCQPFSAVGKRKGDEDPKHLFPDIINIIKRIRPRFIFLENVEGIISAKLQLCCRDFIGTPVLLHVLRELEREGYEVAWGIFSSEEIGAPHRRKRVFILAHSKSLGCGGRENSDGNDRERLQESEEEKQSMVRGEVEGCGGELAHSNGERLEGKDKTRREDKLLRQDSEIRDATPRCGKELADSECAGLEGLTGSGDNKEGWEEQSRSITKAGISDKQVQSTKPVMGGATNGPAGWLDTMRPARPGQEQFEWEEPRTLEKGDDGLKNKTDRLIMCGNGVDPVVAGKAFSCLIKELNQNE